MDSVADPGGVSVAAAPSGGKAPDFFFGNIYFTGAKVKNACAAKCASFELKKRLKEYYEIVDKKRPLSAFFPTHADSFTEMHFYS